MSDGRQIWPNGEMRIFRMWTNTAGKRVLFAMLGNTIAASAMVLAGSGAGTVSGVRAGDIHGKSLPM